MSLTHESPLNIEQIEKNFAEINPALTEAESFSYNKKNMKRLNKSSRVFTLLCLIVTSASFISAGPGIDTTFGNQGIVTTNIHGASSSDHAHAMVWSAKRIVVVGSTFNDASKFDFAVVAYKLDGKLDNTFGNGGKIVTQVGNNDDHAYAVAIQGDWKIVVAGTSYDGTRWVMSVVRYTTNGTLDTTFGAGGKVFIPAGTDGAQVSSIAIQPDGKIILAGSAKQTWGHYDFFVARLTKNGSLDTTFGATTGVAVNIGTYEETASSVVLLSNQKFIVAGTYGDLTNTNFQFAAVRFMPNGSTDTTFGKIGNALTPLLGISPTLAVSIAVQSTGKIVVSGYRTTANAKSFVLVRYDVSGKLDTSFGNMGMVTTPAYGTSDYPIKVRPDNKIIAAGFGSATVPGGWDGFGVKGYSINGAPLASYGTGKPIAKYGDSAKAIALQPDGKVLVAGTVNFGSTGTSDDFAVVSYLNNW
jgi:uncharacterized delta-60 repeat protein